MNAIGDSDRNEIENLSRKLYETKWNQWLFLRHKTTAAIKSSNRKIYQST
jgi:hypothetical protein